jgi:hypothetical protein
MNALRNFSKSISYVVTAGMVAMSLHIPVASATMVGTETVVKIAQAQQQRAHILASLNREDVKAKLKSLGVEPTQVQARVGALTDDETRQLAKSIDEMPAGGDILGSLVLIFLVLLITDLLGLTDVYSFTRKGSARP